MLQAAYKRHLVVMILIVAVLIGCGADTDVLDPLPGTDGYSAILTVMEVGEETLQIDTLRETCTSGEAEPWSDTLGTVAISVDAENTGVTLDHYTIEYIPLVDVDVTAPTLTNPSTGYSNAYIGPGETLELPITLISTDVKYEFNQAMDWIYWDDTAGWVRTAWPPTPNPRQARYYVRVTLYFVTSELELTVGRTVYFSDYDRCE